MQCFDNNSPFTPEEAAHLLREVAEANYFLTCAAEKMNTLTAAHKHHLSDAIDRVNDSGKVVDQLIKALKLEL